MREDVINLLKNSLGNGKVKVLLGAYSNTLDHFLEVTVKNEFENSEHTPYLFDKDYPKDYLFKYLNLNISSGGVYLISHITNFDSLVEIINIFSGRNDIDLICSSDINFHNQLGDDSTLVRGRIQNILFPPFLYDDYLTANTKMSLLEYVNSINETSNNVLDNYKYSKQAKAICLKLNEYIGYPVSFRALYESSYGVSLNTFISIINFLGQHGFIYAMNKFDIKKMDVLPNYLYCYPCFTSIITKDSSTNEKKIKRIYETLVVAKLFNEKHLVYRAVYRNSENEDENALKNTFIVFKDDKRYFLKIGFNDNEASLNNYRNAKLIYPKVVLLLDDIDTYVENNGVIFMSVKNFLKRGFSYGEV